MKRYFGLLDQKFKEDKEFVVKLLKKNENIISYFDYELLKEPEIIIEYTNAKNIFNLSKEKLLNLTNINFTFQ